MVNLFGEDKDFKFEGAGFQTEDLHLELEQVNENKLESKVRKQFFRRTRKIENDIEVIKGLVEAIAPDEELLLMSRSFDSPDIVIAYAEAIRSLYVATWAVTPAGISALQLISESAEKVHVLLDKTHSYKWIFQSGAIGILGKKVQITFASNHSKFMAIEFRDGTVLNVTGSMNLSNNPRWENMRINRSREEYEFLKNFVETVGGDTL